MAERTRELLVTNNRLQVEIAERQNTEAALVQSQKLQAVGQLAGGIAHDFNNLLATVQGSLDLLSRGIPPEQKRQRGWIERASGAVYRGSQLTGRLLSFSRRQRLVVEASDVAGWCATSCRCCGPARTDSGFASIPCSAPICGRRWSRQVRWRLPS